MHKVFKLIGENRYRWHDMLEENQIDFILAKLNISVYSQNSNKNIYLKIGLSKCTPEEAADLLLEAVFEDKLSQTLKSYYKFKLLSNVEDLFESSFHQKEIFQIYHLLTEIQSLSEKTYSLTDFDFFAKGFEDISSVSLVKFLAENSKDGSKLKEWYSSSFNEEFANTILFEINKYSDHTYRVLVNSYWFKLEDLKSLEKL